jgi:hypothetical protein
MNPPIRVIDREHNVDAARKLLSERAVTHSRHSEPVREDEHRPSACTPWASGSCTGSRRNIQFPQGRICAAGRSWYFSWSIASSSRRCST